MTRDDIAAALDGGRYRTLLDALGPEKASLAQRRAAVARYEELESRLDPTETSRGLLKIMNVVLKVKRRDLEPFVSALTMRPPEIRAGTIQALVFSPYPHDVVGPIRERLATDPSPYVRNQAAIALGALGDAQDTEALLPMLLVPFRVEAPAEPADIVGRWQQHYRRVVLGPPTDVRLGAAHALGKLEEPRATERLLTLLDDPDYACRAAALDAIADPAAIPALEKTLADVAAETPEDQRFRAQIQATIGSLRDPKPKARRPR